MVCPSSSTAGSPGQGAVLVSLTGAKWMGTARRVGGAPPSSGLSGLLVIRTATVPSTPATATTSTSETVSTTVVRRLAFGSSGSPGSAGGASTGLSIVETPSSRSGCR
ncbi:hypothetical protein DMB42_04940 [Nonomuraea sp. WAC 01424]|nr:hypothetical protein DMB42_04940 [Nonomuraea sp. WAC 01424]